MRTLKPIRVKRAPTFTADPTSTQYNELAKAFNDRLLLNAGDFHWRSCFAIYTLGRNLLRPDHPEYEAGTKPAPIHEFLKDRTWEDYTAENTTTNNRFANYLYGNINKNVPEINDKLFAYPGIGGDPIVNIKNSDIDDDAAKWNNLISLRGIVKTDGTYLSSSLENAHNAHIRYAPSVGTSVYEWTAPCFAPVPAIVGECYIEDGVYMPSYQLKFTNIENPQLVVTYEGTCQSEGSYFLSGTWLEYVVGQFQYVGEELTIVEVARYKRSEWIQGPYDGGGRLMRVPADEVFDCVLMYWLQRHVGDQAEWLSNNYNNGLTFDFQRFYETQYYLAPNYSADNVNPKLNYFTKQGPAAGDNLVNDNLNTVHDCPSGFCVTTLYVVLSGNVGSSNIKLEVKGNEQSELIEVATDHNSYYPLKTSLSSSISVVCNSAFPGLITVYYDQIKVMKPDHWDAYFTLRLGGLLGTDTFPDSKLDVKEIEKRYFDMHIPIPLGNFSSIDTSEVASVSETMALKQFSQNWFSIIPEGAVVSYEVSQSKSVLYLDPAKCRDCFDNICELEAYKTTASVNEYTNDWICSIDLKPQQLIFPDELPWQLVPTRDNFMFYERSYFLGSPDYNLAIKDLNMCSSLRGEEVEFYRYGKKIFTVPEVPSGYKYYQNTNGRWVNSDLMSTMYPPEHWIDNDTAKSAFCQSNKIYDPPYYIESVTKNALVELNGNPVTGLYKVVFNERFNHSTDANNWTIVNDPWLWDYTALFNDKWRTTENGIMSWVAKLHGTQQPTYKLGDVNMWPSGIYDYSEGIPAYVPTFRLQKLVPRCYEDGNNTYEDTDTRCECRHVGYMDFLLKAGCNGFIDGVTSGAYTLKRYLDGNPVQSYEVTTWDYLWNNLNLDATGKVEQLAGQSLDNTKLYGWGPLPNTNLSKALLNNVSSCINKLRSFRVMLPFRVYYREGSKTRILSNTTQMLWGNTRFALQDAPDIAFNTADVVWGEWQELTSTQVQTSSTVYVGPIGEIGGTLQLAVVTYASEFKIVMDPIYLNALPYNVSFNTFECLSVAIQQMTSFKGVWQTERGHVNNGNAVFCPMPGVTQVESVIQGVDDKWFNVDLSYDNPPAVITGGMLTLGGAQTFNAAFSGTATNYSYLSVGGFGLAGAKGIRNDGYNESCVITYYINVPIISMIYE